MLHNNTAQTIYTLDTVVYSEMETKYYVSMTDKFMSGWGMAEGKTNKYVVECDTYQQAKQIERAAKRRSEMKHVNVCFNKPRYNKNNYVESNVHFNNLGGVWLMDDAEYAQYKKGVEQ